MRSPSRNKPPLIWTKNPRPLHSPRSQQLRGRDHSRPPIQGLLRRNLFYYDFCQIKWAKIVHYLLENYPTSENIKTKDVLLCSRQREMLRRYYPESQKALVQSQMNKTLPPHLYIEPNGELINHRHRLLHQLGQAKLKRQLSPKSSQQSMPRLIRTNTRAQTILDKLEEAINRSGTKNFEALISSQKDIAKLYYQKEQKPEKKSIKKIPRIHSPRGEQIKKKSHKKERVAVEGDRYKQNPYLLRQSGLKGKKIEKVDTKSRKSQPSSRSSIISEKGTKKNTMYEQGDTQNKKSPNSPLHKKHRHTKSDFSQRG